ncbi:MAG: 50S ribosomal protein L15 [Desulfobulbus sp.]|jgi:large subunit ribosomal protein L15|uniref:50S ribosomal protein L15 n=1 Tax=Desulfobulbus sp. TaxID=895 RepID=UPI00283B749E|nr:50S ribosomal protein L15 [Desulfobulbus sp.]MDR2550053.1 50S ribosomal protein L15 [Desulfobulbus sp.]
MLTLNNLAPSEGARKAKKRVGRGPGSGSGKTAARGHKGARARSGYSARAGFEGGQMPLHRRLPKRGFNNIFKKICTLISLDQLNVFDAGTVVDYEALVAAGYVKKAGPVKVLANGEIGKALTVRVDRVSQGAKDKIIAAGGSVEE